jgi:hypothetical protein
MRSKLKINKLTPRRTEKAKPYQHEHSSHDFEPCCFRPDSKSCFLQPLVSPHQKDQAHHEQGHGRIGPGTSKNTVHDQPRIAHRLSTEKYPGKAHKKKHEQSLQRDGNSIMIPGFALQFSSRHGSNGMQQTPDDESPGSTMPNGRKQKCNA